MRECLKIGDEVGACSGVKNVPERISVGSQADEPAAWAYNLNLDRLWWKSEKLGPKPCSDPEERLSGRVNSQAEPTGQPLPVPWLHPAKGQDHVCGAGPRRPPWSVLQPKPPSVGLAPSRRNRAN